MGKAVSLAVPFMLKDADKRENLLQAAPQLGFFAACPERFAEAYVRLQHGEGYRRDEADDAEAA
ncbi:hypothetical protein [Pseudogemmobacter bohemicus]|uniref:hypothetical protein n=1 Tax=Pseudogemmobacter bohemicus TaxID=2250708 RepID=UPI000DD3F2AC|nr:hypothetical protein [Pseudogemmobacter bohemicus]